MSTQRFVSPRTLATLAAVCAIVAAVCAAVFFSPDGDGQPEPDDGSLLKLLPAPDADLPFVVIEARARAFPSDFAGLFLRGGEAMPGEASPAASMLPVVGAAREAALIATMRDSGVNVICAFSLTDDEVSSLASLSVPKRWARLIPYASIKSADVEGDRAYRLSSMDAADHIYIEMDKDARIAFAADSLSDLAAMRLVRSGDAPSAAREWRHFDGWECRALVSDGGIIAPLISPAHDHGDGTNCTVALEVRMRRTMDGREKRTLLDRTMSGRAEWNITGLEHALGHEFVNSLAARKWGGMELFIPDPLIAAAGIDLPDPGRDASDLPSPLHAISMQLERLGLRPSDVRKAMTGPTIASLGGRTQVLWFDLPGLAVDLHERGGAAGALVERSWSTFFGVSPKPAPGFAHGGAVDVPFTMTAAATDDRAVIGLTAPDVETNTEITELLAEEGKCVAWAFVDIPKLGDALAEMPTFNEIMSGGGDLPMEEAAVERIHETAARLGQVFAVFETPTSGRAAWYD